MKLKTLRKDIFYKLDIFINNLCIVLLSLYILVNFHIITIVINRVNIQLPYAIAIVSQINCDII